jgi:hypothetical protein
LTLYLLLEYIPHVEQAHLGLSGQSVSKFGENYLNVPVGLPGKFGLSILMIDMLSLTI